MRAFFFLFLFSISSCLYAIERQPWFGKLFEFEPYFSYSTQYYRSITTPEGSLSYHHTNQFFEGGVRVSPLPCLNLEINAAWAETKSLSGYDHAGLAIHYLVLDDVVGDFASLSIGYWIDQAPPSSVRDPSSFHQGHWNHEIDLSIGKELSCGRFWTSRFWSFGAVGIADEGSPWIHYGVFGEFNRFDEQQGRIGLEGIQGFGKHNFPLVEPFSGYGSLHYRALDLATGYRYSFCDWGIWDLAFSYRVMAQNCPKNLCKVVLTIYYPFGL